MPKSDCGAANDKRLWFAAKSAIPLISTVSPSQAFKILPMPPKLSHPYLFGTTLALRIFDKIELACQIAAC
jgi:hypothetical protein